MRAALLPRLELARAVSVGAGACKEGKGGFGLSGARRLPPGKPAELQRRVSADGQPFQHGDKATCLLDTDTLRGLQEGHGRGSPRMAEVSRPARGSCARPPHSLGPWPQPPGLAPGLAPVRRADGHRAQHHRSWGHVHAAQPARGSPGGLGAGPRPVLSLPHASVGLRGPARP